MLVHKSISMQRREMFLGSGVCCNVVNMLEWSCFQETFGKLIDLLVRIYITFGRKSKAFWIHSDQHTWCCWRTRYNMIKREVYIKWYPCVWLHGTKTFGSVRGEKPRIRQEMYVSGQFHASACFIPRGKDPCYARGTGSWMGIRGDLDKVAERKIMPWLKSNPWTWTQSVTFPSDQIHIHH
jgi:hypothetical protein